MCGVQVSIRICDPENGQAGERATSAVLPCLLNITLQSAVKEVRAIGSVLVLCRLGRGWVKGGGGARGGRVSGVGGGGVVVGGRGGEGGYTEIRSPLLVDP